MVNELKLQLSSGKNSFYASFYVKIYSNHSQTN